METILENTWLSLNIVFGLWSSRNWILWIISVVRNVAFSQSTSGQLLDLFILSSAISYYLTYF